MAAGKTQNSKTGFKHNRLSIYLNIFRLSKITGLSPSEFYLINGEYISPEYYKKEDFLEDEVYLRLKQNIITLIN